MRTVKLLSWHEEVAARAKTLEQEGVAVDARPLERTSRVVTEMAGMNPAAMVLDMDRLPSNAREVALMLRASKSARHIPILLAGSLAAEGGGGLPERYARLKAELPDLPYAAWTEAAMALAKLLDEPMTGTPVVPPKRVYTASLAEKLGIVSASRKGTLEVTLFGAPEGFVRLLGEVPETVHFTEKVFAEDEAFGELCPVAGRACGDTGRDDVSTAGRSGGVGRVSEEGARKGGRLY